MAPQAARALAMRRSGLDAGDATRVSQIGHPFASGMINASADRASELGGKAHCIVGLSKHEGRGPLTNDVRGPLTNDVRVRDFCA